MKLRNYQVVGVNYLQSNDKALLHDDMGLGKTIQVLMSLGDRTIVVCPSQMKGEWERECAIWRPDLIPIILSGRGSFRFPKDGEVIIVNYEILPKDFRGLATSSETTLVSDESHRLKNPKAQRTVTFKNLAKFCMRVWLLTGTPMLNKPQELWDVLSVANLAIRTFGSYTEFMQLFNGIRETVYWGRGRKGTEIKWYPQSEEQLQKATNLLKATTLGRRKHVVAKDLPSKSFHQRVIDVNRQTMKELSNYSSMFDNLNNKTTLEELLGNKVVFEEISKMRAMVATAKIPALLSVVEDFEDNGEPLVVFSAHKAPIQSLATRKGWRVITGSTPAKERTSIIKLFQEGKLRGVGGTKAMCEGITLTYASNMVFVDRFWTPGLNNQAEDRIHRIGQEKPCMYIDLVANHAIDHLVTNLLTKKKSFNEVVERAAS